VPEQPRPQPERGGERGVERDDEELLVEEDDQEDDHRPDPDREPEVRWRYGEDVPEQEVSEIHRVPAHGRDEGDPEGEHAREHDPDRRVLLQATAPAHLPDPKGGQDRRSEGPKEDRAAVPPMHEVPHRHPGEDGVGERVAEERHPLEDDVRPHHGARPPYHHHGEEGPHHERVRERTYEKFNDPHGRPRRSTCR